MCCFIWIGSKLTKDIVFKDDRKIRILNTRVKSGWCDRPRNSSRWRRCIFCVIPVERRYNQADVTVPEKNQDGGDVYFVYYWKGGTILHGLLQSSQIDIKKYFQNHIKNTSWRPPPHTPPPTNPFHFIFETFFLKSKCRKKWIPHELPSPPPLPRLCFSWQCFWINREIYDRS